MEIYISQLDENEKILPILRKYKIGLEVVQFASPYILDNKEFYTDEYKYEMKEIIESRKIIVHGPYADLIPGTRDNLIKEVTMKRFEQGYKVAQELGCKKIIYHNSYTPKTYTKKEWMDNAIRFWKEFMKDKDKNIEVCIENTMEEDYEFLKELIDKVNNPNFKMCLDIGHINVFSKIGIIDWVKILNNRIGHVHIHNNTGDRDSHSGITNGNIDILEILEALRKNIEDFSISLEILNIKELEESLKILKNNDYIEEVK